MGVLGGVTSLVDFRALFRRRRGFDMGGAGRWGGGERGGGFFAGAALVLAPVGMVWGWGGLVPSVRGLGPEEVATRAYLFWHGAEVLGDIDPYRAAAPSWILAPLMWRALLGFPFGAGRAFGSNGIFSSQSAGGGVGRIRALPLLFAGAWMLGIDLGGGVRSLAAECSLVLASGRIGGDSSVAGKKTGSSGRRLGSGSIGGESPHYSRSRCSEFT